MLSALTEIAAGEKSYDEFPRQIRVLVYGGVHVVGHTENKSFFYWQNGVQRRNRGV